MLDIVEILDGKVLPTRCSVRDSSNIDDEPPGSTSKVWDEARLALEGVFGRYSIARLAEAERGSRKEREGTLIGR